MLVVGRQRQVGGLDGGTPLPSLQQVGRQAESTMEDGGKGDRLECGQMPSRADLSSVFHGRVGPSGDGLPGGY